MSTPFPSVVQRWVNENNKTIAELDTSGNVSVTGSVIGNVTGNVTGTLTDGSETADALIAAGAINVGTRYTTIVGPESSTYAVTLAAPTRNGLVKVIRMLSTTDTNAVTLALTNVYGGSAATSASFNAADETLILVSADAKWIVQNEIGVTLT